MSLWKILTFVSGTPSAVFVTSTRSLRCRNMSLDGEHIKIRAVCWHVDPSDSVFSKVEFLTRRPHQSIDLYLQTLPPPLCQAMTAPGTSPSSRLSCRLSPAGVGGVLSPQFTPSIT